MGRAKLLDGLDDLLHGTQLEPGSERSHCVESLSDPTAGEISFSPQPPLKIQ